MSKESQFNLKPVVAMSVRRLRSEMGKLHPASGRSEQVLRGSCFSMPLLIYRNFDLGLCSQVHHFW